jgi:hypothetical protein
MEKHAGRSAHKVTGMTLSVTHTPVYCLDLDESLAFYTKHSWASRSAKMFPWARKCAG